MRIANRLSRFRRDAVFLALLGAVPLGGVCAATPPGTLSPGMPAGAPSAAISPPIVGSMPVPPMAAPPPGGLPGDGAGSAKSMPQNTEIGKSVAAQEDKIATNTKEVVKNLDTAVRSGNAGRFE